MAAHRAGRDRIDAGSLTTGITAAAQLAHADSGALGALLPSLAGGVDALRLLEGWLRRARGALRVAAARRRCRSRSAAARR